MVVGELVRCRACGKIFAGRIPAGGDGSAVFPYWHKNSGARCIGSYESGGPVDRNDSAPEANDG
jgi:hypothetical protein